MTAALLVLAGMTAGVLLTLTAWTFTIRLRQQRDIERQRNMDRWRCDRCAEITAEILRLLVRARVDLAQSDTSGPHEYPREWLDGLVEALSGMRILASRLDRFAASHVADCAEYLERCVVASTRGGSFDRPSASTAQGVLQWCIATVEWSNPDGERGPAPKMKKV